MELPNAVHHHAGEKGIAFAGDRLGQGLAPVSGGRMERRLRNVAAAQGGKEAGLYFFAMGFGIAANGEEGFRGVAANVHDGRRHRRRSVTGKNLQQAFGDGRNRGLVLLRHEGIDFFLRDFDFGGVVERKAGLVKRALVLGSGEGGDYVGGERGQLLRL